MAEEGQPQSIADRIAALKLNQVGRGPLPSQPQPVNNATTGRPRPPPPPRPALPARPNSAVRTQSSNVPTLQDHATSASEGIGNLPERGQPDGGANGMRPPLPTRTLTASLQTPALPPRRASESPALPPRRPSEAPSNSSRRASEMVPSRRGSNESASSIATARSAVSAISTATSQSDRYVIRAPSYDASALPALPPKRSQEEKDAEYSKFNPNKTTSSNSLLRKLSTPNVLGKQIGTTPPPPARPTVKQPPSLPSRSEPIQEEPSSAGTEATVRQRTQAPPPKRSALSFGLNEGSERPPPLPGVRPGSVPQAQSEPPPPVPTGSRPDLSALIASKPKLNGSGASPAASAFPQEACLLCRDYSGPDDHAARFPRQSIPSQDVGWLAQQLTAPFTSHTDKARALFTWLHHNVEYDTVAFFGNNVKPSTPQGTIKSGLAVCEGYAGLFAALAMKAGLEAYVLSGHGKGYGYSKLKPGESIPPYSAGHAWNVVKIDGGQWKLIDCCWGAGAVNGANQPYQKRFAPERFTQSNDDFGLDHFPGDSAKQFRTDGRTITWEEYMIGNKNGCAADFCAGFTIEEGISTHSFQPIQNPIVLAQYPGPTVRFSFQKICPHWDPVRCGKGPYYMYVLHLDALDGSKRQDIPFETNGDVWWCDVPKQDVGRAGQTARVYALTEFNGKSARNFPRENWANRVGSWAYGGVCTWEIA